MSTKAKFYRCYPFSHSNSFFTTILEQHVVQKRQLYLVSVLASDFENVFLYFLSCFSFSRYRTGPVSERFPTLALLTSKLSPVQIFFGKASFSALSPLPTKTVSLFPCVGSSDWGWENEELLSRPTDQEAGVHSGTVSGYR